MRTTRFGSSAAVPARGAAHEYIPAFRASRRAFGGGRLDAGMAVEERVTFCRICEPLCGMVATVEDGRLTQLRPDRDHPLSQGYACPKGIAMEGVQNDPDRVALPAAAHAAARASSSASPGRRRWATSRPACAASSGSAAPSRSAGTWATPGAFSYSHTLWAKGFLDGIGSPHYYSAGSQDVNNRFAASALLYGSPLLVPIPDLNRTRLPVHGRARTRSSHTGPCSRRRGSASS